MLHSATLRRTLQIWNSSLEKELSEKWDKKSSFKRGKDQVDQVNI